MCSLIGDVNSNRAVTMSAVCKTWTASFMHSVSLLSYKVLCQCIARRKKKKKKSGAAGGELRDSKGHFLLCLFCNTSG